VTSQTGSAGWKIEQDFRTDSKVIKAVVCDIEGTTSSISFVKDELFPYAAEHLPAYLRSHLADPAVRKQLKKVAELTGNAGQDLETLIEQLLKWIQSDTKATPLKALQGMVWKHGYETGRYQAHLYQDALEKLIEWHGQDVPIYIYSSGSVQAQKLFFQYSCFGDLRSLFSGYFDTTTGAKTEVDSYREIADAVGARPSELLFLSDTQAELDAAAEAGLQTTWLVRPGDSALDIESLESEHPLAASFGEIRFH
jgi:enolase-phosphatase E1